MSEAKSKAKRNKKLVLYLFGLISLTIIITLGIVIFLYIVNYVMNEDCTV